jgi:hypothetical protein
LILICCTFGTTPYFTYIEKAVIMDFDGFCRSGECPTIGETMAEFKGINLYIYMFGG